ncbi:hypothetical protein ACS0TY_004848 [Phlomoides rotata]
MEEDVGLGSGLVVSKMPLSGELPTEPVDESMGGEEHVEGSYGEGDEGEIMVEVVGSDVFVNGVSGHNGDLEGHEWENREENTSQKTSEAMDVWNEGDVLDEEVWNPKISAMVVSSSTVKESVVVKCEAVDVETVVIGKVQTSEKEEILADLAQLEEDSAMFHEATNASDSTQIVPCVLPLDLNAEDQDNIQFGGIDVAVGEVVLVIATEKGEREDRAFKGTSTDTDSDIDAKIVDENNVFAAESKDSIVKLDAVVSNVQESGERTCETNEETMKLGSLFKMYQPGYLSTPTNDGHFAHSDLVWGKVQNHPWWPGQIFDHADASEKAMKYHRKDSHLVAYFGERTFAWNNASDLKPFMPYFSQIEKQSNSEAFQTSLNSALEEVSRRVELGLTCSCIPKGAYIKIGTQVIENPGIREESSRRCGMNHSTRATSFEPDKLVEYISNLALSASSSADRLDLVIAKAQLSAFYRFKGYRSPTEFLSSSELMNNDLDTEHVSTEVVAFCKHRSTPMDDSHSRKARSLTELMADKDYSPDAEDDLGKSVSPRKWKALDHLANGSADKRVNITSAARPPRPFLGIGIDGSSKTLSQLQSMAQDSDKTQNIENSAQTFVWGYRSSSALNEQDRKRKAEPTIGGSGEVFEFDDANDSYWKDRVVQNHSGEQPSIVQNYSAEQLRHDWQNQTANPQPVPLAAENSVKTWHLSNSRKRSEPDNNARSQKQGSSPAELILNFAERKHVPSEINLNKMFRRFGSLMESETKADRDSGCAKVIFKRGSDAEVALNSAEKFNIFGPVLVKYKIGYSPLISVKISPLAIPQRREGASQNGMVEEGNPENVINCFI